MVRGVEVCGKGWRCVGGVEGCGRGRGVWWEGWCVGGAGEQGRAV